MNNEINQAHAIARLAACAVTLHQIDRALRNGSLVQLAQLAQCLHDALSPQMRVSAGIPAYGCDLSRGEEKVRVTAA